MPKKRPVQPKATPGVKDGRDVIAAVLAATAADVENRRRKSDDSAARRSAKESPGAARRKKGEFKPELTFAISFAKHMGNEVVEALEPHFPGIVSGEKPSQAVRGMKRVDVRYSTPEAGLGLALSFKSVHKGEANDGDSDFIHNMKRNDEELRVEATGHHLRQPYAVMAAVLFLPMQACDDSNPSSFASWVEYFWPLKGRKAPEDPPDRYELVFIALYARDGSELGFYEVGGGTPCPRRGRPKLATFGEFVKSLEAEYDRRNGRDFYFEGEDPSA